MPTGSLPTTETNGQPCIVALDMGYGHLRAAAALADACGAPVLHADRPPLAGADEQRTWARARIAYEWLSRRAAGPAGGFGARWVLERLTDIPELRDGVDLSASNLAAQFLDRRVREGLGAGLVTHLRATGAPLVATFYAPAVAADRAGAERVHCVVTDSDVNRVWVPHDPRASRINFLVPTERTALRLRAYGVAAERVRVTGFPLPPELLGGPDLPVLRRHVAERLARLDPSGRFRAEHSREIDAELPPAGGDRKTRTPLTIAFAVGGAGAQSRIARDLVPALRPSLLTGEIRLVLVAGTRNEIAARFRAWTASAGVADAVEIVHEPTFDAYLRRFHAVLASTDVLWTKPSEMTFYGALGLPLVLAPPLGTHERRNREWATQVGVGIDPPRTRDAARALLALRDDGTLAHAAWAGFRGMPAGGTYRILDAVRG